MPDDEEDDYGAHFGRLDILRTGFFDDPPAGPFDEYTGKPVALRDGLSRGKGLHCPQRGGLFARDFKRIFAGEAFGPGLGPKRKGKKEEKKLELPVIRPPGGGKLHSTPGDWYGCIGKPPSRFDPEVRPQPEAQRRPSPNCTSRPNPKGGPGYLDITINPYVPMYLTSEPYDRDVEPEPETDKKPRRFVTTIASREYFDENPYREVVVPQRQKRPKPQQQQQQRRGSQAPRHFTLAFPRAPLGKHSGCFDRYPRCLPEPYEARVIATERGKPKCRYGKWAVTGGPPFRNKYTISIVDKVTRLACNQLNFIDYKEQVYPLG